MLQLLKIFERKEMDDCHSSSYYAGENYMDILDYAKACYFLCIRMNIAQKSLRTGEAVGLDMHYFYTGGIKT